MMLGSPKPKLRSPQIKAGEHQTEAGESQSEAGEHQTKSGKHQTKAVEPQTDVEEPQTKAGEHQIEAARLLWMGAGGGGALWWQPQCITCSSKPAKLINCIASPAWYPKASEQSPPLSGLADFSPPTPPLF